MSKSPLITRQQIAAEIEAAQTEIDDRRETIQHLENDRVRCCTDQGRVVLSAAINEAAEQLAHWLEQKENLQARFLKDQA